MSSTNPPPDLSTAISTLVVSAPGNQSIAVARRRLAPHRKYAQKFLTLPDELLINICDNIPYWDLPNLRLTCKALANIAAKHFGEKKLAHSRFIFTEYSLQGLVDMTAHPIFGPCIKSIMFGDGHVTEDLMVVMDACNSNNTTNDTEVMQVLRTYSEHWRRSSKFLRSDAPCRLLRAAFRNLLRLGTEVCVGIFGQSHSPETDFEGSFLASGYGSVHDYAGLPFVRLRSSPFATLRYLRAACSSTNFRPKMFVFDLDEAALDNDVEAAYDLLLLNDGQIRSLEGQDICIIHECVDIRILSSSSLVEFQQGSTVCNVEDCAGQCDVGTGWLGQSMKDALFATRITKFRMKGCSTTDTELIAVLKALSNTLQVVEMIDVVIWPDSEDNPDLYSLLHFLRDNLRLQKLVLDDLRAWQTDSNDWPVYTVAKGRLWNGQQQVREGLSVLVGFNGWGLDDTRIRDEIELYIRHYELKLQQLDNSNEEHPMNSTKYFEEKTSLEEALKKQKKYYKVYKAKKAKVKEAMDRVEAGEFTT